MATGEKGPDEQFTVPDEQPVSETRPLAHKPDEPLDAQNDFDRFLFLSLQLDGYVNDPTVLEILEREGWMPSLRGVPLSPPTSARQSKSRRQRGDTSWKTVDGVTHIQFGAGHPEGPDDPEVS